MTLLMTERLQVALGRQDGPVYGAFSTSDQDADGYYLVQWIGEPYTLQEDEELTEYTPAIWIKAGEAVCKGKYFNKVQGAQLWYTAMEGAAAETETLVRMKHVVAADLKLAPISEVNKLPHGMNKKKKTETTKKKALKIDPLDHERIGDEIIRREAFALEEEEEDDDSEEEEEEDDEDEEEEGEEDA
eukprot:3450181-Prymnesium_polylepis.1